MIATLLAALAGDESLVDTLVAAARDASPEVARLPVEESRRHVALLFTAGLAAFQRPADGISYADAERLGADRAAQGVPIAGLLRGVQAARTRLLEIAVERGRAAGIADEALLSAALDFDRYVSALERHVVDGHHAAERALARGRRDQRDAVLRALLLPGRSAAAAGDVALLGLRGHMPYRCMVFNVTDPGRADALEAKLAMCGGVFGTVEGRLAGLAARPPGPVDPAVLVVTGPPLPLDRAAAGYRLCVAALVGAARFGVTGRQLALDLAGPAALAAQPELAGLLADEVLAALDPADAFHRELAATALSYLDHGQRLDRTAAAMHVHPNTVRYRLRALHERTALPLDDATVLATLRSWWALRTWLDGA
ncbi:PucR family transcriptional regulator [Dactylosporangium sp. NPDC051541]|uniref:PucR family transcriptional regulator n=1 Tax=Dactylosporangium sp. NPDC051541 TaxID=3363977 RepID=UPI00379F0D2B